MEEDDWDEIGGWILETGISRGVGGGRRGARCGCTEERRKKTETEEKDECSPIECLKD